MSKFSDDPNRKLFIKSADFEAWQCWDYKTFYMTIRKQDQLVDRKYNRDEKLSNSNTKLKSIYF